jgi:hypothetical protein
MTRLQGITSLFTTAVLAACSASSTASTPTDAGVNDAPPTCGQRKAGLFTMTIDGDMPACLKNKDGTPSSTFDTLRVNSGSVQIGDFNCDGGGTYGACSVDITCAAPIGVDDVGYFGKPVHLTIDFGTPTDFTATFKVDIPQIACAGTVTTRGRWLL